MKENFTLQNLLVKYIYKETTKAENLLIEDAMNEDFDLYEKYVELFEAKVALPKVTFSPKQETLSGILAYSKKALVQAH